jgi:hypothetical protein
MYLVGKDVLKEVASPLELFNSKTCSFKWNYSLKFEIVTCYIASSI